MTEQIEVIKKETDNMLLWAEGLLVETAEDYKSAFEKIGEIKNLRSKWLSYWNKAKTEAYNAWKTIVGMEKKGLTICDSAELTAKQKADSWRIVQEAKAAEEQRRLQAEEDRKARVEKEHLEKEAAKLKTPEKKAAKLEEAAEVIAPTVTIAKPVEAEGVSVRITTKARLISLPDLIAAAGPGTIASTLLEFNEKAANSFARGSSGKIPVPGVEFYKERTSSVRK